MRPNDPATREQAERQLLANRKAARRLPDGSYTFAHQPYCRAAFVRHILQLRAWLRAHSEP